MERWTVLPNNSEILAVHAALLHTGEILYFSGDEHDKGQHDRGQIDHTRLFNCQTLAVTNPHSPARDLFCCGHAFLDDGRLLVAGGTAEFPGEVPGIHHDHFPGTRDSFAFDPTVRGWQVLPLMNPEPGKSTGGGRWYPTLMTLPAGQVLAMSGHPAPDDTRHNNTSVEGYSPDLNRWILLFPGDAAHEVSYYPRLHLLPNGHVFSSSPVGPTRRTMRFNPTSGEWFDLGPGPSDTFYDGFASTSVLLPLLAEHNFRPRVLICGGSQPMIIDLGSPTPGWIPTAPRALAGSPKRRNLNAVLLPTGEVFVCGGVSDDNQPDSSGVLVTELFNPDTNQWRTRASAELVRNYHSVALLMSDGRIWTAGSNHNAQQSFPNPSVDNRELRIEIYEPPYFSMSRPQLSGVPDSIPCGATFDVMCPQAALIRRAALLRAGSCTHAFNPDQRYIGLQFTVQPGNRLRVTAPPDNFIAPPGYYLLFLVDNQGVPSVGQFTLIPLIRRLSPTLKQVFSGGDGIVYAVMDNGDLLWYRHDGRGDGSFRWTDNNARKVGVGWNFKHVFSGGDGVIYAIADNGDLLWFHHDGRDDGSFRWTDNNARKVGVGWNMKHVFSGGDGVIYAIADNGDLLWFRHDGRGDGSFRWADNNARKVGIGWNFKHVFSGGDGVIYAVTDTGDLLWFRHDGRGDGSFRWTDNNARKVGVGWNMNVFSGGGGVIYAIADNGDLLWFRHDGRDDGSFKWADNNARKVGVGWNFSRVIYAIADNGDLLWFRHDGRGDGSFTWGDTEARKVGVGWNMKHVFSGGDGVLYAIADNGDLLWFRHEGGGDGSFRWADNNARKVGVGWNMKHVFSGGDGVIYAVADNGDLLWFRHEGRGDGSFRWVDNNARKVGVGWNMKHVFSGGDGVIYAVADNGDLLWFRHDGQGDGSFRWADNNARKVGVGWSFKHVFSA